MILKIQQKDILLVPFPFSNQQGNKVRPVLVFSNDQFNKRSEDVIVMAITSNISKDVFSVFLDSQDIVEGILRDDCCVKVESILKLDKNLIIKKLGGINEEKFKDVVEIFDSIVR
jgi:mRNA interferase MazF